MSTKPVSRSTGIALVEETMKNEVANIRDMISGTSGNRLTVSETGDFIGIDGRNLGPEIVVSIIDYISANRYYPGAYNRNNPAPPACFALGKIIPNMAPHETAPEPQANLCSECPKNKFGSAPGGGNGKACKNTRDLVLMLEQDFGEEPPIFMTFSVAPTSLKSFDALARYAADVYEAHPLRVLTKMTAIRQGNYFSIQFAPLDENEQYREHFALRDQVQDLLFRLPDYSRVQAAPTARANPARR